MTAQYRIDCKLANYNRPGVCSEPWYMTSTEQMEAFKAKHLKMDRNDSKRMVFVINELVDGVYTSIYQHKDWFVF